jgi:hypothetical protein
MWSVPKGHEGVCSGVVEGCIYGSRGVWPGCTLCGLVWSGGVWRGLSGIEGCERAVRDGGSGRCGGVWRGISG